MFKKLYIDKVLLRQILRVGLPVMIQQLFLTTLGIVDSIMVGSIDNAIGAVGVAVQIEAIMMTVGFGVNSGIAIYISQFYGSKEEEKIKKVFSLMLIINIINSIIFTYIALYHGKTIINFLRPDSEYISLGYNYLKYASLAYLFISINYAYSFMYRNIQRTRVIMYSSAFSMIINVLFNYLLIFGIGIFPQMGVAGAGLATVISSLVGVIFNTIYTLKTKQMFIPTVKHFVFSLKLSFFSPILKRSLPLILNEALFSIGGVYYIKYLNNDPLFEGYRIAEIIVSFFFAIIIALSSSATAILGQVLGAKQFDKAKSHGKQFMLLGVFIAFFLAILNIIIAVPLVSLFGKNEAISMTAISVLYVFSLRLFLRVFIVLIFSSLRAGGKSRTISFLDAGIMWMVGIPAAYIAAEVFNIQTAALLFLVIQVEAVIRLIIGLFLFFRYKWIKNLTNEVK